MRPGLLQVAFCACSEEGPCKRMPWLRRSRLHVVEALVDKRHYKWETELAWKYSKFGPWKQPGRAMWLKLSPCGVNCRKWEEWKTRSGGTSIVVTSSSPASAFVRPLLSFSLRIRLERSCGTITARGLVHSAFLRLPRAEGPMTLHRCPLGTGHMAARWSSTLLTVSLFGSVYHSEWNLILTDKPTLSK